MIATRVRKRKDEEGKMEDGNHGCRAVGREESSRTAIGAEDLQIEDGGECGNGECVQWQQEASRVLRWCHRGGLQVGYKKRGGRNETNLGLFLRQNG